MPKNSRRRFLKQTAVASSAAALASPAGILASGHATDHQSGKAIKVAGYDYDRLKGIMDGRAGIEGASVSFHYRNIYEVNRLAFGDEKTFEVSELGLIPYINRYINEGFRDYVLIPVFISRVFRHRNIFVHADSGITTPEQLKGRKVGTPGYGMSANTWIRGMLKDEYGVEADDFEWIETTESSDSGPLTGSGWNSVNEDGSPGLHLPADFPISKGPEGVDESELLLNGDCDALITAITPKSFLEGNPKIRRLFPNVKQSEQAYFSKTGLFPIMHVVGIRADSVRENPELPRQVFDMYEKSKLIAYKDLETTTSLKVTLPWVTQEYEATRELMGDDYWPYGIEANSPELILVMRYVYEQGLVGKHIDFRELFHPSLMET